ncbi:MAG TPA: hypothetical protein VF956_06000 [Candidatus Dormibacteraeota bacterium]
MRNRLMWASATLALVIAACGSASPTASSSPANSCVNASAAHHAYVVVEHLSGTSIQKCVGFTSYTIDGQTLMDQSTIEYQKQAYSFGNAACQIDSEPAQFTECFSQGKPYWSLFVETGGVWASAQTAYNMVNLHDKEALGWHYVDSSDQNPAPPPLPKES